MTLTEKMEWKTYSDAFWGPDFRSVAGAEALTKRNTEAKRMCAEFEEYLRKRSKLELEYSKNLAALTKCFRDREAIGVLEQAFSSLKDEINTMSRAHQTASDNFHKQADTLKKFKEEQTSARKLFENSLHKSQEVKLSQHAKTLNLQKTYVKKSLDRDSAEVSCKEISISPEATPKEQEKARNKAIKMDEDAQKADVNYKGGVLCLEDCRVQWEHEMLHACQSCQELDEERLQLLRGELWFAMNVDSMMALEVDNSCEKVRAVLEKCDVMADIQAFIQHSATGTEHPEPFVYQHYSKLAPTGSDSDSSSLNDGAYSTIEEVSSAMATMTFHGSGAAQQTGNGHNQNAKTKMNAFLSFPRKKKKGSATDE